MKLSYESLQGDVKQMHDHWRQHEEQLKQEHVTIIFHLEYLER